MQSLSTILIALSVTSGLTALPVTETNTTYIELSRQNASNGTLVWYGLLEQTPAGDQEVHQLVERKTCKTGSQVVCSTDHAASNDLCKSLFQELQLDHEKVLSDSPRQVCFLGDATEKNEFCCVSWSKAVPGLTKQDIWPAVQSIMAQCTTSGISGRNTTTQLQQTCATVCVSNRGTKCA